MFNIAQKVALAEGSAQDIQFKKKDKFLEGSSPHFDRKGENRVRKNDSFTPMNASKESLTSVIKEKYRVQDPTPMRPQTLLVRDKTKYCGFHRDYATQPRIVFS